MSTLTKKQKGILLSGHLLWWGISFGRMLMHLPEKGLQIILPEAIALLLFFYINYTLVLPIVFKRSVSLLKLLGNFVTFIIMYYLFFFYTGEKFAFRLAYDTKVRLIGGFNMSIINASMYQWSSTLTAYLTKLWLINQPLVKDLEEEKHKFEHKALQTKLNSALVGKFLNHLEEKNKLERISDDIISLSEILRYQLYETKKQFVSIEIEKQHLENYLNIAEKSIKLPFNINWNLTSKSVYIQPYAIISIVDQTLSTIKDKNEINISVSTSEENLLVKIDLETTERLNIKVIKEAFKVVEISFKNNSLSFTYIIPLHYD